MADESTGIVIGIDLGTTFSAVAMVNEAGKPEILPNAEGEMTTPSIVQYASGGTVCVGREAKNVAEAVPEQIVAFAKNDMGKDRTWTIDGKSYRPEQVSAAVLTKLVQDAEAAAGKPVTGAVVTVPAIFGDAERMATRQAAQIAKVPLLHVLNEPEAAALHYIYNRVSEKCKELFLVLDLGGGTFDLTLIQVENGERRKIKVLYTDGDRSLGGKLWDDRIIAHACARFESEHGFDPSLDLEAYQSLRALAETAKMTLTTKDKAIFSVSQGKKTRIELTRTEFDEMTRPETSRVRLWIETFLKAVIERGNIGSVGDVSRVLLVGGSARMPQIQDLAKELLATEIELFEPDLAVAKGAAIFAVSLLAGEQPDIEEADAGTRRGVSDSIVKLVGASEIETVSSFALGTVVRTDDPRGAQEKKENGRKIYLMNDILIPRNTSLPLPEPIQKSYSVPENGTTGIVIIMVEGEERNPEDCVVIGEGVLSGIPSSSRAGDTVEFFANLTSEGLITVDAHYAKTGAKVSFTLQRKVGLDRAAIHAMQRELSGSKVE